jgi:3-isopropylmalate/(R)-2-methylmalate dehydratase large subunit
VKKVAQTLAEKILARHSGRDSVKPDDFVMAELDLVLGNDITAPVAIKEFRRLGAKTVFDKDKIALICDHFTPNKDILAAEQVKYVREFAREHNITHFYDVGDMGIEHCLIPEKGLAQPGYLIIGADSHTCTYGALGSFATGVGSTDMAAAMAIGKAWFRVPHTQRFNFKGKLRPFVTGKDLILYTIGKIGVDGARYQAMEFGGEVVSELSVESRLTMANMAIEAGAKAGLFAADAKTVEYLKKAGKDVEGLHPDPDASYYKVYDFDVSDLEPQVAFPHLPENAKSVREAKGIKVDQVVVGSCTNGRIEDLRQAAEVLRGRKVHRDVRMIVIPGTQQIYLQAIQEGLVQTFIEAGAAVSTPTCGPCLGGHMGILASGEVAISTTNRNFVGRMGHPQSAVYLAGPYVAAASAVAGEIVHPEEVLS